MSGMKKIDHPQSFLQIPKDKLPLFIAKVYALSCPVGLGGLQFKQGDIPEETLQDFLQTLEAGKPIYMDYVHGRQCKMGISVEDGKYFIYRNKWQDHSHLTLTKLLTLCDCLPADWSPSP